MCDLKTRSCTLIFWKAYLVVFILFKNNQSYVHGKDDTERVI